MYVINEQESEFLKKIQYALKKKKAFDLCIPLAISEKEYNKCLECPCLESPIKLYDDHFKSDEILNITKTPSSEKDIEKRVFYNRINLLQDLASLTREKDSRHDLYENLTIYKEDYLYEELFLDSEFSYPERILDIKKNLKKRFAQSILRMIQKKMAENLNQMPEVDFKWGWGFIKKKVNLKKAYELHKFCLSLESSVSADSSKLNKALFLRDGHFIAGYNAYARLYHLFSKGALSSCLKENRLFNRYPFYLLHDLDPDALYFLNPKTVFYLALFEEANILFDFNSKIKEKVVYLSCSMSMGMRLVEKSSAFVFKLDYL